MRAYFLSVLLRACAASRVFDVDSYGGRGDGITLNSGAFAAAVADAHAYWTATATPGTVLAHGGVFLSGQIVLLSGVVLSVAPDARLLASASPADYPADPARWAFLFSDGATDVGITGGGIVDGQFQAYIGGFNATNDEFIPKGWPDCVGECRPRLTKLTNTERVEVFNISFINSPDWTFHLLNTSWVHVYNWTQRGDERWPNNDGIDIDSSSHVLVEDSDIDTADDGVCIKGSAPNGTSINVTVRRTRVRSRSSAVKYGSNIPIPMRGHLFEDLYIHDSNRGLALQARDGGDLRDVTFRRVVINGTRFWPWKWWGDGGPLYISSMLRDGADTGTQISNITFEDIDAVAQNAAVLSGTAPGKPIVNITLRRVRLHVARVGNYTLSAVTAPSIEYDPHISGVPGRINITVRLRCCSLSSHPPTPPSSTRSPLSATPFPFSLGLHAGPVCGRGQRPLAGGCPRVIRRCGQAELLGQSVCQHVARGVARNGGGRLLRSPAELTEATQV
jgi:polygalacturonase